MAGATGFTDGFSRRLGRPNLSRRRALAGATSAIAAAFALTACSSDPTLDTLSDLVPQDGATPTGTSQASARQEGAPLSGDAQGGVAQGGVAPGGAAPGGASDTNTEIRAQLDDPAGLVVQGRRLDTKLLRGFYARHAYQPVWATRTSEATSLIGAVQRAPEHGLDPNLFHADLLQPGTTLLPPDRELLLSDAFLSYADALARGVVPVERRKDDEVLAPEPIDVPAALDAAIGSPDPAAAIEALAPTTPTYRALREALQAARRDAPARVRVSGGPALGMEVLGIEALCSAVLGRKRHGTKLTARKAGRKAVASQVPPSRTDHARAIEVNLERQRWLPRQLPPSRVWVNVADERLVMYRAGEPAFSTAVVVGEDVERNQSPEFRATIDASFYNPPWVIPADIAAAEILPKLVTDPDYLTRNKMVMLAHGEVEQLPGPDTGLGLIMFDMPNKFDVYLHDTPDRTVFIRNNRRISHGCIRVENPRELAALLMDQPLDAIDQGIAKGDTTRNNLPTPVPVFVVYQTAFLDTAGALQFRPDFYKRDGAIWQQMQHRG